MKSSQIETKSDLQAFLDVNDVAVLKIMDPWSAMDGLSYALVKGTLMIKFNTKSYNLIHVQIPSWNTVLKLPFLRFKETLKVSFVFLRNKVTF